METFEFVSAIHSYHIYKDIWEPSVGEKLIAHREFGNQFDNLLSKCSTANKQWAIYRVNTQE